MAEESKIIQLIEIQTDTNSLKTLKQEIKEATVEMNKLANGLRQAQEKADAIGQEFGTNSEQFKKASAEVEKFQAALVRSAKEVADLKDNMDDVNDQINAFHPDKKFQGLAIAAQTGATALEGVAGAMAALGVESDTAAETMAKLQGIMAFTQAIKDVKGLQGEWEAFTKMSKASKTALEAQGTATKGTTVATKGLGTAFKALGIGLLIAAVAYLVENWDSLKNSLIKVFPALKDMGALFDKVKQIAFGVGNVLLQHVVAPIKAIVKAVQGDFKGAINEFKNGFNVIKNYQAGVSAEVENQKERDHKKSVENQVKRNAENIEIMKAAGKDTFNQEKENLRLKKELAKENKEELEKLNQEEKILDASHAKQLADQKKAAYEKAQQQREQHNKQMSDLLKQEREKLAQHEQEINSIIDEGQKEVARTKLTEKEKELFDNTVWFNKERNQVQGKYDEDLKILQAQLGRKAITQEQFNDAVLKLNQDSEKANAVLTEQKNIKDFEVTKKYNKQISDFLDQYNTEEFQRRRAKVAQEFDDLIQVADEAQKKALENARNKALNDMDKGEEARKFSVTQETNYVNTVTNNMPEVGDTPEDMLAKEDEIYNALKVKKEAQFQEQLLKLGEDQEAIALLKAQYRQQDLADEEAHKEKIKLIDEAVKTSKLELASAVGGAISQLGGLFKKNTAASKIAALADIAIGTGVGFINALDIAQKSAKATGPGAAFAFPIFYATQAAAVLSAAAKAKSILAKVEGPGSSGGDSNAPQIQQAPQINATNLNVQPVEVRATHQQPQLIQAFISDKDLKANEAKTNFLNKLSSF